MTLHSGLTHTLAQPVTVTRRAAKPRQTLVEPCPGLSLLCRAKRHPWRRLRSHRGAQMTVLMHLPLAPVLCPHHQAGGSQALGLSPSWTVALRPTQGVSAEATGGLTLSPWLCKGETH